MVWAGNLALIFFLFTGAFAFIDRKWRNADRGVVCAVSAACTVMVLYVLLLTAAILGFYNTLFNRFVQIGFAVLFVALLVLLARKGRLRLSKPDRWDIIFYGSAIVLLVLNIVFAHTTLLGGRDEGIYFDSAMNIARTGNLVPHSPPDTYYFQDQGSLYPGIYTQGSTPIVQFSNLLPLILSYFYRCFGIVGITMVNPILSFFGSMMFYQVLKRMVSKPLASIFSVMFGWNILQIWFSRITLTEILAQLLILCAVYLTILLSERPTMRIAVLAGLLWGSVALTRNDGLLLLTVVAIICVYLLMTTDEPKSRRPVYLLGIVSSAAFTAAYYTYRIFSRHYYLDLRIEMNSLMVLGIIIMAFGLLLGSTSLLRQNMRAIFRVLFGVGCTVLIGGFLVVSDFRPYFPIIDNTITRVTGIAMSTQTQDTFPRLQMYLGIGVVVAALFGALIMARRALISRLKPHMIVLATVASYTALYLFNMRISPDLHWGMRRFMPAVVPGLIIAAAVLISWLIEHKRISTQIGIAAACVLMLANGLKTYNVIAYADRKDEVAGLEQLEAALPDDGLIFTSNLRVGTTLYMAYGHPVYAIERIQSPIQEDVYYLLVSPTWMENADTSAYDNVEMLDTFYINSTIKERVKEGMPLDEAHENYELQLIRITAK